MRTTRTYVILEVAPDIYGQIRTLLANAGYDHAFLNEGKDEVIDMHGIAIKVKDDKVNT